MFLRKIFFQCIVLFFSNFACRSGIVINTYYQGIGSQFRFGNSADVFGKSGLFRTAAPGYARDGYSGGNVRAPVCDGQK